jgi:hypothetical protein
MSNKPYFYIVKVFENVIFPVYRKYRNNRHFFKILSGKSFEEKQVVGKKVFVHVVNATQLPEFNLIYDLVFNFQDFGIEITEDEYLSIK